MAEKNIRSPTIRKEGRDLGLTPTEKRRKDVLMRQFCKGDAVKASSAEFRQNYDAIDWSKG